MGLERDIFPSVCKLKMGECTGRRAHICAVLCMKELGFRVYEDLLVVNLKSAGNMGV